MPADISPELEMPPDGPTEGPFVIMVDVPEPTEGEIVRQYSTYRRMGGDPIKELERMAARVELGQAKLPEPSPGRAA